MLLNLRRLLLPGLALLLLALSVEARVPANARSRAAVARVRPALVEALADSGLAWGAPVFIRIFKEERELEVWIKSGRRYRHFRTWPICHVSGGLGPKIREGDGQAPEGFYFVPPAAFNPASSYHLSFNIGYPNAYDRALGRTGGAIMVHGSCVSIGCFAMTDSGIEKIYALAEAALDAGQPYFRAHIFPFRMTEANLRRHLARSAIPFFRASHEPWRDFWSNLKEGYDWFERHRVPPDISVRNGRYRFGEGT
jgi:murein L,D-transpeptidase YafK